MNLFKYGWVVLCIVVFAMAGSARAFVVETLCKSRRGVDVPRALGRRWRRHCHRPIRLSVRARCRNLLEIVS